MYVDLFAQGSQDGHYMVSEQASDGGAVQEAPDT